MLGIMLKDMYEAFCLKKNLMGWILYIITYVLLVLFMPTPYVYILVVTVAFPMTGVSILQYSVEQDEISKFDKIMLTYPMKKKEIILSKYLSGMILQAMIFTLNFVLAMIFSFGYKVIEFSAAMEIWFVGVIFSCIYMAINYVIFFWLGLKKGSVMFVIFLMAMAMGYVFAASNIGVERILEMDKTLAMILGFVISILALIGSYYVSVKIYTKKYIK